LSAYPVLVQGLRNNISHGFTADIGDVLATGARAEVIALVSSRFNVDGHDPIGRKVGLLDWHHLMAFLCATFKIQTPLAILMREMIYLYIPLDEDGGVTSRLMVFTESKVSLCDFLQAKTYVTNILIELCTFQLETAILHSTG